MLGRRKHVILKKISTSSMLNLRTLPLTKRRPFVTAAIPKMFLYTTDPFSRILPLVAQAKMLPLIFHPDPLNTTSTQPPVTLAEIPKESLMTLKGRSESSERREKEI